MPAILRRVVLLLVVSAALCSPLAAQAEGRWACRADSLSGYNCAQYYSGTVTLASELTGANVRQSLRVVATIAGGRVSCEVKGTEVGEFSGPGMLVVAHAAARMAGGGYDISVWCPDSADSRPSRRSEPYIKVMRQQAADYGVLEGRDAHEHPDTDSANGLAGTETITWALRRP